METPHTPAPPHVTSSHVVYPRIEYVRIRLCRAPHPALLPPVVEYVIELSSLARCVRLRQYSTLIAVPLPVTGTREEETLDPGQPTRTHAHTQLALLPPRP